MTIKDSLFLGPRLSISLISGTSLRPSDLQNIQDFINNTAEKLADGIGDIHNESNSDTVVGQDPLYITNIARAIGDMSKIEPIYRISGKLANTFVDTEDLTYNVLPNPNNGELVTIGCKFDGYRGPSEDTRDCLKNQDSFYQGTVSQICQNATCPLWSGNEGTDGTREYRLVFPTEARQVPKNSLIKSINGGLGTFRPYRVDNGGTVVSGDINQFYNTADKASSGPVSYEIPLTSGLATTLKLQVFIPSIANAYDIVLDDSSSYVEGDSVIGDVSGATGLIVINDTGTDTLTVTEVTGQFIAGETVDTATATISTVTFIPHTYNVSEGGSLLGTLVTEENVDFVSAIFDTVIPASRQEIRLDIFNTFASNTYVALTKFIDLSLENHPNFGIRMEIPKVFQGWVSGSKLTDNMFQLFDTDPSANSTIQSVEFFKALFDRDFPNSSVDIKFVGQELDPLDVRTFAAGGAVRYLVYTVGTSIAALLSKLTESFLKHVIDSSIHLSVSDVCAIISDGAICCSETLSAQVISAPPSVFDTAPATAAYTIAIQGGSSPYRVDVQWGDGNSEVFFTDTENDTEITISHQFLLDGIYLPSIIVRDGKFNCFVDLTSTIGPIVVGNVVGAALEQRIASPIWPAYAYQANVVDNVNINDTFTVVASRSDAAETFVWNFSNTDNHLLTIWVEKFQVKSDVAEFSGGQIDLKAAPFLEPAADEYLRHRSPFVADVTGKVYKEGTDYTVDYTNKVLTSVTIPNGPIAGSSLNIEFKTYPAGLGIPTALDGGNPATDPGHWIQLVSTRDSSINVTQLAAVLPTADVEDPAEIDVLFVSVDG